MRIIGGKFGRRVIKTPKNLPVRPTTDLAKESLFNILNNQVDLNGIAALDLFSGTGAIAYEFVSRGCATVSCVEQNFNCIKFIKSVAENMEMDNLSIIKSDVFRFLKTNRKTYDIIFADPPYAIENLAEISNLVFENKMLNPNGLLIIEHPAEVDFSEQPYFKSHRNYSKVNFSFFEYL